MKHILIASDLSAESLRPFQQVAQWAREWGSKLTLLHVVQDLVIALPGAPMAPPTLSPGLSGDLDAARAALEVQRASLGADLDVQCVVTSSDRIPSAISAYAAENDVDLIALSTHGRTGWRHLALGSVAEAVLRHTHIPVITFPREDF